MKDIRVLPRVTRRALRGGSQEALALPLNLVVGCRWKARHFLKLVGIGCEKIGACVKRVMPPFWVDEHGFLDAFCKLDKLSSKPRTQKTLFIVRQ